MLKKIRNGDKRLIVLGKYTLFSYSRPSNTLPHPNNQEYTISDASIQKALLQIEMLGRVRLNQSIINDNVMRGVDPLGDVFLMEGKVFRAVRRHQIPFCVELFMSGAIEELDKAGLLVPVKISRYYSDENPIILEQDHVRLVPPFFQSREMLIDSLRCAIAIHRILAKYGFGLHDPHMSNFAVWNGAARYLDVGSILPGSYNWNRMHQSYLLEHFVVPILVYDLGETFIFRKLTLPQQEMAFTGQNSVLRTDFWKRCKTRLRWRLSIRQQLTLRNLMRHKSLIHDRDVDILFPAEKTPAPMLDTDNYAIKISEIVNEKWPDVRSATVLGGKNGEVARKLIENTCIDSVISVDQNEREIDRGYKYGHVQRGNISYIVANFMRPTNSSLYRVAKSELVIAPRIMSSLLLWQRYSYDFIISRLAEYCQKFLLIDFTINNDDAPVWYGFERFTEKLVKYFDILKRDCSQRDKVILIAKIIKPLKAKTILY